MFAYVLRRLLYIPRTLLIKSIISFVVIHAPPGDYLSWEIGQLRQHYGEQTDRYIGILGRQYRLEQPILCTILCLDYKDSFSR